MADRHRGFRGSQRSQRLTTWIGPADQGYVNVASGGATLITSFAFEEPATIMRTRAMVSFRPQSTGADLDIVGAFGMGVVSAEAFAAGVASIPEPFSDADWGGWFVWQSFGFRIEFSDATGIAFPRWDVTLDSKAMRKVGSNEVAVFVAESQAGAYAINTPVRMLVKLT